MLWNFPGRPKWTRMNAQIDKRTYFGNIGLIKNRGNESWALASHDHKNLTFECPHRCMHDQFCIKFPNHHFCICVMEIMWGIPFIPEPNQTPTCIMSSHSTNLEPKSWLTINLDPGWECQSLPSEAKKEKKGNSQSKSGEQKEKKENSQSKSGRKQKKKKIPIKEWEKAKKKERKFPIKDRKKTEETCRKVFGPDNIWTIQNCHQMNKRKERKPWPKVVFSLWLPTKIPCASDFFFLAPH